MSEIHLVYRFSLSPTQQPFSQIHLYTTSNNCLVHRFSLSPAHCLDSNYFRYELTTAYRLNRSEDERAVALDGVEDEELPHLV